MLAHFLKKTYVKPGEVSLELPFGAVYNKFPLKSG